MKLKVVSFVGALALVLVAASSRVMTVTNGQPDGNGHPFVGTVIQPIPSMPGFVSVCSGSALSDSRFLTAAHCADPSAGLVFVSYGSTINGSSVFTPGVFTPDPQWCEGCGSGLQGFDSHDVAVVSLLSPAPIATGYAQLPSAGQVDTLAMMSPVDIVGYGVQGFLRGHGKPEQVFLFTRFFAPSQLVQSNNLASDQFIKMTANPSKGTGGVCFGDSGGPDLIGGTHTVIAVNSFVSNTNCSGVTYSQRVDLPDILAFIRGI
ncbi:MAG TPA: trypsin-like serine protease [Vicinamibacterales bacterium]|nr:trypsin-like serine protease [Vicinamibacterales bacterium]